MHVFLINALGNTMALDSKVVPSSTSSSSFGFFGMLMAFTFTMFCLFIGFEHGLDPSENHWAFEGTWEWTWPWWDSRPRSSNHRRLWWVRWKTCGNPPKKTRMISKRLHRGVFWRWVLALGPPWSSFSPSPVRRCYLENIMRETNHTLDGRMHRFRQGYGVAAVRNDQLFMGCAWQRDGWMHPSTILDLSICLDMELSLASVWAIWFFANQSKGIGLRRGQGNFRSCNPCHQYMYSCHVHTQLTLQSTVNLCKQVCSKLLIPLALRC